MSIFHFFYFVLLKMERSLLRAEVWKRFLQRQEEATTPRGQIRGRPLLGDALLLPWLRVLELVGVLMVLSNVRVSIYEQSVYMCACENQSLAN